MIYDFNANKFYYVNKIIELLIDIQKYAYIKAWWERPQFKENKKIIVRGFPALAEEIWIIC